MSTAAATPRRFLYIAKEQGAPADEFKVGKTHQLLERRMASMGGQTDAVFDLVAAFPTLDEGTAETMAFEQLDELGLRKKRGSRKELFVGDLAVIQAVCQTAVARADKRYAMLGHAKADAATQGEATGLALTARQPFWKQVLAMPVQSGGKVVTLGALLQRAQQQPALSRRAEKLGILQKAYRCDAIEFEIVWHKAPRIVEWLKAVGLQPPSDFASRFQAKLAHA